MKKIHLILQCILIPLCVFAQSKQPPVVVPVRDTTRDTILVKSYIHHISDMNFRDLEYKIELWLYLFSKDKLVDNLEEQFQVKDAKEVNAAFIPQWRDTGKIRGTQEIRNLIKDSTYYRRVLKINCTMIQKWDLDGYPFDEQMLDVVIYTIRSTRWLSLIHPDKTFTHSFPGSITPSRNKDSIYDIENGWCFKNSSADTTNVPDIFSNRKFSAIHYHIQLTRTDGWGLFFKLFLGMYVAILVAFISIFMDIERVEPRFGLPVGALFAAIANKYILESLLPPTSQFTLADYLHSISVIFIMIVLAYSALLLFLKDRQIMNNLKRFDWIFITSILSGYVILNFIFIQWGWD